MKNSNIDSMLETVGRIFEAAHTTVSSLNDGDRLQIKQLAETVGMTVGMEPKHVLPFVNHFVHNTDVAYVTRGKKGGIVKGTRPAKVVKVSKKDQKATSVTTTDNSVTV